MKFFSIISVLFSVSLFFTVPTIAEIHIQGTKAHQAILSVAPQSSYLSYNFGQVGVNTINTTTYTITNTGTSFLQFAGGNIWGMNYDANHSCSQGLMPNQRCQFQIRYWPLNLGMHSGQFEIRFNTPTPNQEIINVQLWGEAVQR
jgi:hypothetical protein